MRSNSRSSFGGLEFYESGNVASNSNTGMPKTPPKSLSNVRLSGMKTSAVGGIGSAKHQNNARMEPESLEEREMSLERINDELDDNMNNMIALMNRRKWLMVAKRRKMLNEFEIKRQQLQRMALPQLLEEASTLNSETESPQVRAFLSSPCIAPDMQKVARNIAGDIKPESQERRRLEMSRSQDFWNTNKTFENEIDGLLQRLKYLDLELEKSNGEIQEICKKLDFVEDGIRDLLLQKTDDNVRRAEPLFQQKQGHHNQLKQLLAQRTKLKDEKIQVIYAIIKLLSELRALRQERLTDLGGILGIEGLEDSQGKVNYYSDFVDQLENVAKIKEDINDVDVNEEELLKEMELCSKETEVMFAEFVKRSSDEAKVFADYGDALARKMGLLSAVEYFVQFSNLPGADVLNLKDLLKQFKDNILFLKPLIEEDSAIQQGLKKTADTINTFSNILRAIENEKERRRDLIRLMENCQRLKDEEETKHDSIREVELEVTKKQQQKNHLEEDLDNILADADLEQYKRLGATLKSHELGLSQLFIKQNQIDADIQAIQKEFLRLMDTMKSEYDDIVKEVLPNNIMGSLDFRNAKDIRLVKNYLMKTFKRLGINFEDS